MAKIKDLSNEELLDRYYIAVATTKDARVPLGSYLPSDITAKMSMAQERAFRDAGEIGEEILERMGKR